MPTAIEWTDETWNPITGCSIESPGCTHCYAMKLAGGRLKNHRSRKGLTRPTKNGPVWTGEVRRNPEWLSLPLRWRRARQIFVCAHADLFHPDVPLEWIDEIWAVMALARHHTYQVLTKRSTRMRAYLGNPMQPRRVASLLDQLSPGPKWNGNVYQAVRDLRAGPLRQVWCGVSIEDRKRMLERAPDLQLTAAAVRFWSAEPLLGDLGELPFAMLPDQIIIGGESGQHAREFRDEWAGNIIDQAKPAGTAVFMKQRGAKLHPKSYKDFESFPEKLRVREYPAQVTA